MGWGVPRDSNNRLNLQLSDGLLVRYKDGIGGTNVTFEASKRSFGLPPLMQIVPQNMDLFKTWFAVEQPIIVSDPEGCGRNLMIRHSISRLHDELDRTFSVAVLHYNTQKSSKDVLQKLRQFHSITPDESECIYRPEEGMWDFPSLAHSSVEPAKSVHWCEIRSGKSYEVFSVCSPRSCIVPRAVSGASRSAKEVLPVVEPS